MQPLPSPCATPLTQVEAITRAQERRRTVPVALVIGFVAIPVAFITVVMPLITQTDLWFIIVMDILLVGGLLVWRAIAALRRGAQHVMQRSNIERMNNGDVLLHWTYQPDEWQRFAAYEYARDRCISTAFMPLRRTLLTAIFTGALIGGVMLLVNSSEATSERTDPIPTTMIIIITACGALLPLLYMLVHRVANFINDRKAANQRRPVPEIRLNARGLHGAPGGYLALSPKTTLRIEAVGPLSILTVSVPTTSQTRYGTITMNTVERVLVPRGHEDEAQRVARTFRGSSAK